MLPIIKDSNLDLFDPGLEEVFMTNNEPKVEEEDDVLRPKNPSSPPPPIFPHHHSSKITKQGWLIRQLQIQSICLLSTMLLLPDGMMKSLACIPGVLLNFKPQMPLCLR